MSFLSGPITAFKNYFSRQPGGESSQPAESQEPQDQPPLSTQLKFSKLELEALCRRIDEDYRSTIDDQQQLRNRWADEEADWRNTVGLAGGEDGHSNFFVQIITAIILAKHAREVEALFGQKAAVSAVPTGPTDANVSKRASLAMKWQVYENMRALKPLSLATLRRLKHGRAFIKIPWSKKFYNKVTVDPQTGRRITERVVYRESPEILVPRNEDIILPSSLEGGKTNFDNVQDAAFIGHRYWDTLTNMLLMSSKPDGPQSSEGDMYQGIAENWDRLVRIARQVRDRDNEKDPTRQVSDMDEGDRSSSSGRREEVEILEWHMKWRRWVEEVNEDEVFGSSGITPDGSSDGEISGYASASRNPEGSGTEDAFRQSSVSLATGRNTASQVGMEGLQEGSEYLEAGGEAASLAFAGSDTGQTFPDGTFIDPADGKRKYMIESNLIVRKCANDSIIIGIQDADEVYPNSPIKRPFFSLAFLNSGVWWDMGLIEMIKNLAKEMTVLVNQIIEASDLSIAPPIFYSPKVGEAAVTRKYEKFDLIPCTDPQGIKQLEINPNLQSFPILWQVFMSLIEMLTGVTQGVMGRGMEQPNAPRTLGGQRLVAGASDVRLALDMRMLAEDLKPVLDWIWSLWTVDDSGKEQFYRVAEGDARDLFDHGEVTNGFAKMTDKERNGNYDFAFEFSDDMAVKEQRKQEMLALLQVVVNIMVFQQDPVAQYRMLVDAFDAFGLDYTKYAKEPPPAFLPITPDEAWTRLLEGEKVTVHPLDDNRLMADELEARMLAMWAAPEEDRDMKAMFAAKDLIAQHEEAIVVKQQQEMMQQALAGALAKAQGGVAGGDPLGALLGGMQGGQPQPMQPQGGQQI